MRKYNNKTKKTMIIILVLCVIIIVIFSYAIKKSIDIDRTAYEITPGSIMFDKENNMITTNTEGIIKIKWGGDYYLILDDEEYDLGTHAVVYNTANGDMTLYGKYYEVTKEGEVEVIKGENLIKSSVNSKFYKLADRKYLIIDRTIESEDSSFVTSNYLIINLDKLGNATLLNDKTSYKTITPTVLRTAAYTFDIANEKLNFGGEDIDLKKIIGSTNEYDEETYNLNGTKNEDDETTQGTGTGSGSGSGSGGSGDGSGTGGSGSGGSGIGGDGTGEGGSGTGTGGSGTGGGGSGGSGTGDGIGIGGSGSGSGGSGGGGGSGSGTGGNGTETNTNGTTAGNNSTHNNNYSSGVSDETVQEIVNATKNTSVIRVTAGINAISVDYVVYDPNNEYKSVYVEVENTVTNQINVVYLSKTDTNITIGELTPNVYYNLTFKYSYYDEKNNLKEYTFDETGLYTEIPKMVITATKITNNKLYYKITLDKNYTITGGTVNLYLNDQFTNISSSISAKGNVNTISGEDCYIDLSSLNLSKGGNDILSIRLVSLSFNSYTIKPSINYKFRY
ncbi:MAG: hypothetical protein IJ509_02665 [Bacilli bacterium]|nr:hypothetical protein [Bacilli bacterium]